MTEKERLLNTLFDDPKRRHVNIKFFRGSREGVSEEAFCREVNSALFQRQHSLADVTESFAEMLNIVDIGSLKLETA